MRKLLALTFVLALITFLGTVPTFAAPATLNPTADSYVYSTSPNSAHGDETAVRSGFWVEFSQKYISLLKFDLSSIPSDAVVTSAQLKLYVKSGISSGTMTCSRNTEDWTEGRVNWNTRPSNDDPRASALVSLGASYISWDVTELVGDWFDGAHANYGFSIVAAAQETDFSADFYSREASENQPELIISYDRPLLTPDPAAENAAAEAAADEAVPSEETPSPVTPSEPTPDRPTGVVEEETPNAPSATTAAAPVPARVATPSAQPTSILVRVLQIVSVVSGLLFFGVAGYLSYKEIKKRRGQKGQKVEEQGVVPDA